jgi:hypothetical protein
MNEIPRIRLKSNAELELIEDYRNGLVREAWAREDNELVPTGEFIHRKLPRGEKRILVVGDLHAPFTRPDYLPFCQEISARYKCNHTVFIGDVIDNHYSSFWDADPDGMGAGDELEESIAVLRKWHSEFPNADVTLGNHDVRIFKQIFRAGVSKRWMGRFADVLETPTWNYTDKIEYNEVIYTHGGRGGAINGAFNRASKRGKSVVQGHHHTASYIRYSVTDTNRIFGMQVGCGIDEDTYAAQYAKDMMSRFVISCGVVLENGSLPILELMRL